MKENRMGILNAIVGALTPVSISGPIYLRRQFDSLGVPRIALPDACVAELARDATATHKAVAKVLQQNWLEGLTDFYDYVAMVAAAVLDPQRYSVPAVFGESTGPDSTADRVRQILRRHGVATAG